MQLANSGTRCGAIPQALHWLTVLCVVAGWLLGQFLDAFPKGSPQAFALLTHMTLGQLVIVLLIARLAWRIANPPVLPSTTPVKPCLTPAKSFMLLRKFFTSPP
jgi:cytochrome b561